MRVVLLFVEFGLLCVVVRCLSLVGHMPLVVCCDVVCVICYFCALFVVCWLVCCLLFDVVVGCFVIGQFQVLL